MMNELHELTAGFYLLAERRGWRPDNLPAFEHQRRAFVFFTTMVPPVLLLIPVYKTGNVELLQRLFQQLAALFASSQRVVAYQKVSLTFLTTLRRAKAEPDLWEALRAALPRCLDVAQETLVSVLSRMTPDVDIQNLDAQRVREVAWSFNVLYPEFHELLHSLNINEEPHVFHANIAAETRLPTAQRQLATMRLLEDSLRDDGSADLISAGANTAACETYVFPACRGMLGGPCGPRPQKDVLWSAFSASGQHCQHRTCLLHASALNMPHANDIPISAVNAIARSSQLSHIMLPRRQGRAPSRRSARSTSAAGAPRIGGRQLEHAETPARPTYRDSADNITTKEEAVAAVKQWKSFEQRLREGNKEDMRHGKDFQRCNCRAAAAELQALPEMVSRTTRTVLCISCGVIFLSKFEEPKRLLLDVDDDGESTTKEAKAGYSYSSRSDMTYICGRHGCCARCVSVAQDSSCASSHQQQEQDNVPFSGDFQAADLSYTPGSQCPIQIKAMEKVCVGICRLARCYSQLLFLITILASLPISLQTLASVIDKRASKLNRRNLETNEAAAGQADARADEAEGTASSSGSDAESILGEDEDSDYEE